MAVFISYARRDRDAMEHLRAALERLDRDVWFDGDLTGGSRWWDAITEQIATCELFVFALSAASVRSKACKAELAYAVTCGRPVLPVRVGDVNEDLAPAPIGSTHIVDYRKGSDGLDLFKAVSSGATSPPPPDPRPAPPDPPMSDLGPLRDRIGAAALPFEEQQTIIGELRMRVSEADQHETLLALMQQLRGRMDLAAVFVPQLDELIRAIPLDDEDADAAPARSRPPLSERPDEYDLLLSLVTHISDGHFTPILGMGLTDSLIGARRQIAREWAATLKFPMAKEHENDLASVAQFGMVTSGSTFVRRLDEQLRGQLQRRFPSVSPEPRLHDMLRAAWEQRRATHPTDIHVTLAKLSCPVYVSAQPWGLLVDALAAEGKDPEIDVCRWRPHTHDWPPSPWDKDPGYVPSVERPLVFHVFGNLDNPKSLVLTEDDYFDFLTAIGQERWRPRAAGCAPLVPPVVSEAMTNSALMFVGFGLEDWDVRVLLRTLVGEGSEMLGDFRHVAAQVDLSRIASSPERARKYLQTYFVKLQPSIDIYWGSVDDFAEDLSELIAAKR